MENLDFSNVGQPLPRYCIEVFHGHEDLGQWYARPQLATDDLAQAIVSARELLANSHDGWNRRARVTDLLDDSVVWPAGVNW